METNQNILKRSGQTAISYYHLTNFEYKDEIRTELIKRKLFFTYQHPEPALSFNK